VTSDASLWVLAALMVVTAAGIAVFWATWLRTEHTEPWLPAGYVEHERAFVVPDSVLAVTLVAAAGLLVSEVALGRSLALVAAGMLAFLGLLDAVYFARTGLFRRARGGIGNLGVVAGVLTLAVLIVARLA
jgi:hypothetical protein